MHLKFAVNLFLSPAPSKLHKPRPPITPFGVYRSIVCLSAASLEAAYFQGIDIEWISFFGSLLITTETSQRRIETRLFRINFLTNFRKYT